MPLLISRIFTGDAPLGKMRSLAGAKRELEQRQLSVDIEEQPADVQAAEILAFSKGYKTVQEFLVDALASNRQVPAPKDIRR